jgi:hypothetical protein
LDLLELRPFSIIDIRTAAQISVFTLRVTPAMALAEEPTSNFAQEKRPLRPHFHVVVIIDPVTTTGLMISPT